MSWIAARFTDQKLILSTKVLYWILSTGGSLLNSVNPKFWGSYHPGYSINFINSDCFFLTLLHFHFHHHSATKVILIISDSVEYARNLSSFSPIASQNLCRCHQLRKLSEARAILLVSHTRPWNMIYFSKLVEVVTCLSHFDYHFDFVLHIYYFSHHSCFSHPP